jgi:hypothetical protein
MIDFLKRFGRKHSCPSFKAFPGNHLKGLRKRMKTLRIAGLRDEI